MVVLVLSLLMLFVLVHLGCSAGEGPAECCRLILELSNWEDMKTIYADEQATRKPLRIPYNQASGTYPSEAFHNCRQF